MWSGNGGAVWSGDGGAVWSGDGGAVWSGDGYCFDDWTIAKRNGQACDKPMLLGIRPNTYSRHEALGTDVRHQH